MLSAGSPGAYIGSCLLKGSPMDVARKVLAELDPELEWIHETYRDLHRHPELSLEETRTSALVVRKLEEFGYRVHRVGGTGVVGVLDNGPGRTVLARADMDALPVREATGLDYASENDGVMHACGHDVHVAALLGAAKLLADHREQWAGTYLALFQPAEETAQGSAAMLADGLADKIPAPDVAFAQHVMAQPAGSLQTVAGPVLSAGDSIRITVHGQGAHGSMPQLSVDPVVLAAAIVLRLQSVVSREVQPGEFAVLTIGSVQVGTKSNIIADRATLLLNLRSYDNAVRETLIAAVERIVRGGADRPRGVRGGRLPGGTRVRVLRPVPADRQRRGGHRAGERGLRSVLRDGGQRQPAERLGGLQPDPRRVRRALQLLAARRNGPAGLRGRQGGGEPFAAFRPADRADPGPRRGSHGHRGAGRTGLRSARRWRLV